MYYLKLDLTMERVIFKNNDAVNKCRTDILTVLDKICQQNNLRYFAFSSLLVGAVHYKDFIPNGLSSLTEIGLLRDEYDKLVEILYKCAKEHDLEIIDRYLCHRHNRHLIFSLFRARSRAKSRLSTNNP